MNVPYLWITVLRTVTAATLEDHSGARVILDIREMELFVKVRERCLSQGRRKNVNFWVGVCVSVWVHVGSGILIYL